MEWIGPRIISGSLSRVSLYPKKPKLGESPQPWQYHSRSDDHSRIAALGVTLDLLQESAELRAATLDGRIGYQVNPVLTDRGNRKKTLDLGIGLVDEQRPHPRSRSLGWQMEELGVVLSGQEQKVVAQLPPLREAYAKHYLIVLENKACMTAHGKAAPRLRNELEGAVDAINQEPDTVAGGLVIVNAAPTFVSPVFRDNGYVEPILRRATIHNQPEDAASAIDKLEKIPLRTASRPTGYDALGIVVVSAANDGTQCTLIDDPKFGTPSTEDIWSYSKFIQELARRFKQRSHI
jgi:hypothetical protein